jgi:hypothetical protein
VQTLLPELHCQRSVMALHFSCIAAMVFTIASQRSLRGALDLAARGGGVQCPGQGLTGVLGVA